MDIAPILDRLRPHVPWGLTTPKEERGRAILFATPGVLLEVLEATRRHLALDSLVDLTCWDRLPASPRFEVVYLLGQAGGADRLTVKVQVEGDAPRLPTATVIYAGAAWPEREVFDMFGIVFVYPWAVLVRELGASGLLAMFSFLAVLGLGYVYLLKRRALEWE